jgi:hypothetical protein
MKIVTPFFKKADKKQCIEFGQLCVLLMLVIFLYSNHRIFISIALVLLLINMVIPLIFYPFASAWFTFAEKSNSLSSVVILSIVFFIIVVPIGLLRKLTGKDNLKLKEFKKGKSTVMITRDHIYSKEDLQHSF